MPVSIRELVGDVAETQVQIGNGTLTFSYRRQLLTPLMLEQVMIADQPLPDDATQEDARVRVWAAIDILLPEDGQATLVKWDLFEDDEATIPVPLTRDRLAHLGIGILWGVIGGMLRDSRMGEANGTPSKPPSPASTGRSNGGGSRKRG